MRVSGGRWKFGLLDGERQVQPVLNVRGDVRRLNCCAPCMPRATSRSVSLSLPAQHSQQFAAWHPLVFEAYERQKLWMSPRMSSLPPNTHALKRRGLTINAQTARGVGLCKARSKLEDGEGS